MNKASSIKVDLIVIDRSVKNKIDLRPSMLLRHKEGGPAIAIINQKMEDFSGKRAGNYENAILLTDGTE